VAIQGLRADSGAAIALRQSKYLYNIVEQNHRAIKRIIRPMPSFKALRCSAILIAGIEIMHTVKKHQFDGFKDQAPPAVDQFDSLAFQSANRQPPRSAECHCRHRTDVSARLVPDGSESTICTEICIVMA
jgi:hypothetical protein